MVMGAAGEKVFPDKGFSDGVRASEGFGRGRVPEQGPVVIQSVIRSPLQQILFCIGERQRIGNLWLRLEVRQCMAHETISERSRGPVHIGRERSCSLLVIDGCRFVAFATIVIEI